MTGIDRKSKLLRLSLGLLAACLSSTAHAIPIKWRLDTVVTELFGGTHPEPTDGDPTTVFMRFDSEGVTGRQVDTGFMVYDFVGPPFGMDVFVAGTRHHLEELHIGIGNNYDFDSSVCPNVADVFFISGLSVTGDFVSLGLFNCDATALDSTDLIDTVPTLGSMAGEFIHGGGQPEYQVVTVACCDQFTVDVLKITVVSEPNQMTLLILSSLGLLWLVRRNSLELDRAERGECRTSRSHP